MGWLTLCAPARIIQQRLRNVIRLHHRPPPQRGNPQKWLRRLHAWSGLALAALLLLFAVTGVLLNHRAEMKIPALDHEEITQIVPLEASPADPVALATLLAPQLGVDGTALTPRVEAPRAVAWGDGQLRQPARWILRADTPAQTVQIEYWEGSTQVEIKRSRPNLWLYLARLHMAIGTGPGWILLADAAACGLGFLALSGFWLWGRLHGPRTRLALLSGGGLVLAALLAWQAG